MLRIGEFASLSNISISMLRNYDKLGLLVPVYIDDINGYRYYDKEQLLKANQIMAMRSMGFGLEEIKSALDTRANDLDDLIRLKLKEKKKEIELIKSQIKQLEETLNVEDKNEEFALSIIEKTIPQMNVISLRGHIAKFNQEGILWKHITEEYIKHGIKVNEDGISMAVSHGINYDEGYIDIEVQLIVDKIQANIGDIEFKVLPKRYVASIIFQGSYSKISRINMFVVKWLETNNYEVVDNVFSIYHNSPRDNNDEQKFITEICFPIAKKVLDSNTV